MTYQSFHHGEVKLDEILHQLNTFTNDGGNVFERSMVVSNLRTFFQTASKKCNDNVGEIKAELLRCRKDGDVYLGFSKNDVLVVCSKDPAAVGIAAIARQIPSNKPFYGMNFIVSPDLAKKIFGTEDITMLVDISKEEDNPDKSSEDKAAPEEKIQEASVAEKSDDNKKSEQSSEEANAEPGDVKIDIDSIDLQPQSEASTEAEESKDPEQPKEQQTSNIPSMAQAMKSGMVSMSPMKQGKHNKR